MRWGTGVAAIAFVRQFCPHFCPVPTCVRQHFPTLVRQHFPTLTRQCIPTRVCQPVPTRFCIHRSHPCLPTRSALTCHSHLCLPTHSCSRSSFSPASANTPPPSLIISCLRVPTHSHPHSALIHCYCVLTLREHSFCSRCCRRDCSAGARASPACACNLVYQTEYFMNLHTFVCLQLFIIRYSCKQT